MLALIREWMREKDRTGCRQKRKIKIPKKIFLVGGEKLTEKNKQKVEDLLDKYPTSTEFLLDKRED